MGTVLIEGGTCRKGLHPWVPENIVVGRSGHRTCRECHRARDRERHVRDHAKRREAGLRWYRDKDETEKRAYRLKRYGLTPEQYDVLLTQQGGVCAICGTDEPGGRWGTMFSVDHDHASGAVRGLLCGGCNLVLGHAKDDAARLRAAARYLEEKAC